MGGVGLYIYPPLWQHTPLSPVRGDARTSESNAGVTPNRDTPVKRRTSEVRDQTPPFLGRDKFHAVKNSASAKLPRRELIRATLGHPLLICVKPVVLIRLILADGLMLVQPLPASGQSERDKRRRQRQP